MERVTQDNTPRRRPSGAPGSNEGVSPAFVFHAVRRWWKIAAPLAVFLGAAAAGVVWYVWEPTFTATSWIRIVEVRPHLAFPDLDKSKVFVATQMQTMRSPLVLGPVLSRPEIARQAEIQRSADPLEYLASQVVVAAVGQSELYTVKYTCGDPNSAQAVVNAVVESYIQYQADAEAKTSGSVLQMLQAQIKQREGEVERLRGTVRTLSEQAGIPPAYLTQPSPVAPEAASPLSALQKHLVDAQVQEVLLQAEYEYQRTQVEQPIEIPDAEVDAQLEPQVREIEWQLAAERKALESMKAQFVRGEQEPNYKRALADLEKREKDLEQSQKELRILIRKDLESRELRLRQSNLALLKTRLDGAQATIKQLTAQLESAQVVEKQVRGDVVELDFAIRQLQQAESVHDILLNRLTQLSTERNAPARVVLEREAGPPPPSKSFPDREILMALLFAMAVPFGLAVGWEYLLKRVSDTKEIEQQAGLEVLGEIAALPTQTGITHRALVRSRYGRQLFEESVDGLRTTLVLSEALASMKVLAVASAISSEGKTSVACQLAFSIAKTSRKNTLLIDGDMRDPDIHQIFDMPLSPGLAEVLAGECTLDEAITVTDTAELSVLSAGTLQSSPHELLHNGAWLKVLDLAKERYDFIVIDTPPVLAASESLVLAKPADATLVCAMRDRSRVGQIRQAHSRLLHAGARPVGVVLSGLPVHHYARRYGGYYYTKSERPT